MDDVDRKSEGSLRIERLTQLTKYATDFIPDMVGVELRLVWIDAVLG